MRLRPYKFQIVPIVQRVEGDRIVGEQALAGPEGQPVIVFGVDGLKEWAEKFEERLAKLAVESVNAGVEGNERTDRRQTATSPPRSRSQ